QGVLGEASALGVLADVGPDGRSLDAKCSAARSGVLRLGPAPRIVHDDIDAARGELERNGLADAGPPARHDSRPARERHSALRSGPSDAAGVGGEKTARTL